MAAGDPRAGAVVAVADLRRARRRRRTADFDAFEVLYRVYITAIVSTVAILILSGVTGDHRVRPATVASVLQRGPYAIGLLCATVWAVGLRSGGRGGPLVLEAADVRHVLLAPVARPAALRPVAWRQVRFGALAGAGVGAVAGLLAYHRLPGGPVAWIATGALFGVVAVSGALGLAMSCSGLRTGRWVGGAAALAIVAWSAGDWAAGTVTSPATCAGELALWPLRWSPAGLAALGFAAAAVVAGLRLVGGVSIEAVERRAALVGQLRFAATLRDIRTVVLLRRQLAQEQPRARPWGQWRLGAGPGGRRLGAASASMGCWRRSAQGLRRFPAFRFGRIAVLGAAAGAAAVGTWRGTTPLVILAGLAMYVAALDAVEPLAQELDHPDRRDGIPMPAGELLLRLAGPPLLLMVGVAAVGYAVAVAVTAGAAETVRVGALVSVPAAGAALAGAAITTIQGPPPAFSATDSFLLPPEAASARAIVRMMWPPVVAMLGLLPVLAAREAAKGPHPVTPEAAAGAAGAFVVVFAVLVGVWARYRDDLHAWVRRAMEETKAQRTPARGR